MNRSRIARHCWRGKMAAPEEQELSQAQTEKLLQFQVVSLSSGLSIYFLYNSILMYV